MKKEERETQIVGLRLAKDMVMEFKQEAAARNMRLNALFNEMWEAYKSERNTGVS